LYLVLLDSAGDSVETSAMADRTSLVLAAVLEVTAGLVLIISPSVFVHLLLAADVVGTGFTLGRVAGVALLSLGVACWPGADSGRRRVQSVYAMLTYNSLVAAFLAYLGAARGFSGILLWPAVVIHGVLALLFASAAWKQFSTSS
jgi:hypothetical protein